MGRVAGTDHLSNCYTTASAEVGGWSLSGAVQGQARRVEMVDCCGFQASLTLSGGGGRGEGGRKGKKKKTTPDNSETDRRRTEREGFSFQASECCNGVRQDYLVWGSPLSLFILLSQEI